jgi:hypothetical protein
MEGTESGAESEKASVNGVEENDKKPAAKKRATKRKSYEHKSIEWPESSDTEAEYVSPRRSFKVAKTATRKPNGIAKGIAGRVRFTEDEVAAIREGIEIYGVGKWQLIINDCNGRLDGRSGVQVKDKFRTMLKSRQIKNPDWNREEKSQIE